ncbi:divergent PAP2 family protein [Fusibacter sp. JL298sf-3]
MAFIQSFMSNKVVLSAITAWFVAQLIKVLLTLVIEKEWRFERFHGSGGMPSSHTATVVAASTAIGLIDGFDTTLYGFSLMMAFVVMYDASGVRRSVGKQAKLLNGIILELYKHKTLGEEKLKELIGHKPTEVAAGALLGIIISNIIV